MADEGKYLTIQEAAAFLRVSKSSLRRWSNTGQLPCYRIGNRNERRFRLDDLLACLSQTDPGEAERAQRLPETRTYAETAGQRPCMHHISSYYRDRNEQWDSIEPHLMAHIQVGTRTLYVHSSDPNWIADRLSERKIDAAALEKDERLLFVSADDAYLRQGHFNPRRMLKFWESSIRKAEKQGVERMFLTGEMGWASRALPGCELLLPYERELDQVLHRFPSVTVLCQYPLINFSGATIFESLRIHPGVQLGRRTIDGLGASPGP